jgi:hypothetical protein
MVAGGVAIVLVFLGITAAVVGVTWVSSHTQVADTTPSSAEAAFEAVRQEFAGRPALIDVRGDRPQLDERRTSLPASTTPLTSFHVLAWAPKDNKLVRVELPFWLIRIKARPIQFSAYASGLDDTGISMTAEELERYGPGIIIDIQPKGKERILLWAK